MKVKVKESSGITLGQNNQTWSQWLQYCKISLRAYIQGLARLVLDSALAASGKSYISITLNLVT